MDEIAVRLVKQGRDKIGYAARVLSDDGVHLVVRAPWAGDEPRDFGFVRFEPGDLLRIESPGGGGWGGADQSL